MRGRVHARPAVFGTRSRTHRIVDENIHRLAAEGGDHLAFDCVDVGHVHARHDLHPELVEL
jgi:hypothetical protein